MFSTSGLSQELIQRDLSVLWHPCTQMKDHESLPLIPITRGNGVWLEDFDGNKYLDAISSWWVNLFGHSHPVIVNAIKRQAETLEHVLLAGFTHEPVIRLSERLVALTPKGLTKCFYADNGSSAVEIALKMSFHYWQNSGQFKKSKFVTLQNSYHGETIGALSVGDVDLYKSTYRPLLFEAITIPSPDLYFKQDDEDPQVYTQKKFAELEQVLANRHDEICAVIVEPLIQCAGHMRMYHPDYLSALRRACDEYNVHFIADEIATGFGRTGTLFACEQAAVCPDFMCLSKGLTGGFLPLSVVLTSDAVYEAFYADYQQMTAFLHSHSYTGNPIACAAANATLDLFESRDIIGANQGLAEIMRRSAQSLREHPHVGDVRQTGMVLAVEMVQSRVTKEAFPWQERRGLRAYQHALRNHVLLRPLGNVLYFMPPYVIQPEQIEMVVDVMRECIDVAAAESN